MASTPVISKSPTDLLKRIHRIEIRTNRLVNELFGGRYLSTFKGRGMEFSDIREYVPGDDIRNIHWKATAKLNQPYVKRFTEERELTILLAVDVSRSTQFGTRSLLKSELAAELVSLLSFSSLKNNDKVGLLLFSDTVENYIPPQKSKTHILRLVREVLGHQPQAKKTNIANALHYINRVQKKRAIVFLISDFLDQNYEKAVAVTQRRHDTIAFVLEDPMERIWPKIGPILLEDAETGELEIRNAGNKHERTLYERMSATQRQYRKFIFSKHNMDNVTFMTNEEYVTPLIRFFQIRSRRINR